jgi:hypothetical protein
VEPPWRSTPLARNLSALWKTGFMLSSPTAFALKELTDAEEARIRALVKKAPFIQVMHGPMVTAAMPGSHKR